MVGGPVKVTFDVQPHRRDRRPTRLMLGFIEAGDARAWVRLTAEQRRASFLDCLERYF